MSYKHITINERCCIVEYLNFGWSISKIARELSRNKSTISREIKRNNLNGRYSAHSAEELYRIRRTKCKPNGKLSNYTLVNYVQEKLNSHWSPEQIAGRIIIDNITNGVHISFTTIYRWIYHKCISKCSVKLLRRKGKSLRPKETRGKFNIGKTIKNRPKEVRNREILGHWELDTVVSSRGKSKACLSTYVERKTRLLKIKLMPNRKADTFNKYCIEAFKTFNDKSLKTLTVDRGKEFAGYIKLEDRFESRCIFC